MKKILATAIIAAFALSMAACGTTSTQSDSDIFGRVSSIDGNTVTIETITQQSPSGDEQSSQGTPPDMPSGDTDGSAPSDRQGTPPEKPDGDGSSDSTSESSSDTEQSTPPEAPSGDTNGSAPSGNTDGSAPSDQQGTPPEKPDGDNSEQSGETKTITVSDTSILYKYDNGSEVTAELSDITVGAILKITYNGDDMKKIIIGTESDFNLGGGQGAPGGNSASDVVYDGATELTAATTEDGKTYATETSDQSALLISTSENVTINNPTVTKSGDSDGGDNCNFYGQNAAVLVKGGSTATITGGTVTTSANGANAVFSYGGNGGQNGTEGDGTTVIISDTTITTTGDGSGGIMTTGGGTTKASNLTVTTSGQSSAAIRSDRGGGTVEVDGGTYTTNGLGSPAIYSTADITVSNATLVSNLSEGVCIEGLNSIELNNTDLTANNTKCNGNATFNDTVMIYQSMSGDAASGTSSFTMNGGTLTSKNGHVFHVTNTDAVITLNGVKIVNKDSDNVLLSVCADGWSGGSNIATLNATKQTLNGAVLVGSDSTLTLNLSDGSTFNGYINGNIKNAAGTSVSTEVGNVAVTLDSSSTWTLTGDSYVTGFNGNASNVISNGYTLYVNGVALSGTK